MIKYIIILNLLFSISYAKSNPFEKNKETCFNTKISTKLSIPACKKISKYFKNKKNKTDTEKFYYAKSLDTIAAHYSYLGDEKKNFEYSMKAYKAGYCELEKTCLIGVTLGYAYYFGEGVNQNKIKAYEFYLMSAKTGNKKAQRNLDIMCKESPWACK